MKIKKLFSLIIAASVLSSSVVMADEITEPVDGGELCIVNVTPADAVVKFYDAEGTAVDDTELIVGTEYTYTASRYGYESEVETVTLGETLEIELDEVGVLSVYGKDEYNMCITDMGLAADGALKWEQQISEEFVPTVTDPVFIDGSIYLIEGSRVVKRSTEDGAVEAESEELSGEAAFYGLNTLIAGDGMIFVPVSGGKVQAIDAGTLESLWISEEFSGEVLTPLTYKNGKLYGGTVLFGDSSSGEFFCIDVTDEDPRVGDETKNSTWKAECEGGFYGAGAYVSDTAAVFGSDNGTVYAYNVQTGELINSVSVSGAVRSSVSYAYGDIYFTSIDGYFHRAPLTDEGIGEVISIELSGSATSTPAVYDYLAYVGVKRDTESVMAIIDLEENTIAEEVVMPGYPQEDAVISTNGGVFVYTTYNSEPGGIYRITVEKTDDGVTASGADFFVPEHRQYCLSNITFDNDGNLYYRNDSGYLFAVCLADADESLEEARAEALKKLEDKFSIFQKSDYSDGNYNDLEDVYEEAVADIEEAENTADINLLLSAAIDGLFSVSCRNDRRITVYISVEKFNIGQGYVAEPQELSVSKYSTAAQVLNTIVKGDMIYEGSLTSDFYVSAIKSSGTNVDIPEFIKTAEGITITENRDDYDYLSQFDYSDQSGWVYTVNGELIDTPASDYIVKTGDIIRFQFSLAGGADIYSINDTDGAEKLYDLADKDELTMMIATVKAYSNFNAYMNITSNKNDYNSALITAQRPTSTQRNVNSAVSDLKSLEEPGTKRPGTSYYPVGSNPGGSPGGSPGGGSVITQNNATQNNTTENNTTQSDADVQTPAEQEIFTDITDHWAKDYIYKLYEKKIITGRTENTFDPQAQLTRAECVVLLSRMAGADVSSHNASGKFADVADGDWFNQAIGWAADNGIVAGMSETEFAPLSPITREQFTVMLSRFVTFAGIELSHTADEIEFTDAGEFADYARDAIGIIQRAGIINGRGDGIFAPRDNITRAETAKMLAVVSDQQ